MSDPVYGWICVGTSTCCGSGGSKSSGSISGCDTLTVVYLGGNAGPPVFVSYSPGASTEFWQYSLSMPGITVPKDGVLVWGVALWTTPQVPFVTPLVSSFNGVSSNAPGGEVTILGSRVSDSVFPTLWLFIVAYVNDTGADVTSDIVNVLEFEQPLGSGAPLLGAVMDALYVTGAVSPWFPTPPAFFTAGTGPPSVNGPFTTSGEGSGRCDALLAFMAARSPVGGWSNDFTGLGVVGGVDLQLSSAAQIALEGGTYTAVNDGAAGKWIIGVAVVEG